MEMQLLYAKLHDKYTQLKVTKESEMQQYNREQELKFMNYVAASEKMIEHLRTTNERLQAKINELGDQMASDRYTQDYEYTKCQNLLIEEKQKSKELSEEVQRLRNLLQEKFCYSDKKDSFEGQLKFPCGVLQDISRDMHEGSTGEETLRSCSGVETADMHEGSTGEKTLRPCSAVETREIAVTMVDSQEEHIMVKEPEREQDAASIDAVGNTQKLGSHRSTTNSGDASGTCQGNCGFQTLIEHLIGMKFSMVDQQKAQCLSVLHDASGYSFTLTWVENAVGEEPELLYHVISLGTFESVAPAWMREDLMFSMRMCAVFFKRLSQIISLGS